MLKNKKLSYYFIGIVLLFLFFVPYIVNGESSYFRIHDYLEQDYVNTMLSAKYLFHPLQFEIPDVLSGSFRGTIQAHSLLQVFAYKLIPGIWFLILNLFFIAFVAYSGMFLLINKLYEQKYAQSSLYYPMVITGCFVYGITPTLMHGLTALIFPFVVYLALSIRDNFDGKMKYLLPLASLFVGLSTSLVYAGMYYVLLFFICALVFLIKKDFRAFKNYFICLCFITLGYIINYFYSFAALTESSHRLEWYLTAGPFFKALWDCLKNGHVEIKALPELSVIVTVVYGVVCIIRRKSFDKNIAYSLLGILVVSLLISIYHSSHIITDFLNSDVVGSLRSIQFDRVCAVFYSVWSFILIAGFLNLFCEIKHKTLKIIALIIFITVFSMRFCKLIKSSSDKPYKWNTDIILHKNKKMKMYNYAQFFEKDLMKEVKDYINKPQNEYKVVSVGMNPAVALFNGFYCLDGYFTNYRLDYKHQFKKVIIKELEKYEGYYDYYETWGSRVYLPVSEFSKEESYSFRPADYPSYYERYDSIKHLDIDFPLLYKMGARYIFSMFRIDNAKNIKLEKVFTSKLTGRKLYLYSIVGR